MHSDHPTLEDKLERKALIELKAEQILNCTSPQTFGIHGDWGAGKTSFLRQLRYHLDGSTSGNLYKEGSILEEGKYKKDVITVWFDAWRYQHETQPVIALLHEIRRHFSAWAKLSNKAKKLTSVTVRSIFNVIDDITKLLKIESIPIGAKGIQKIGEDWEKQNLENRLGTDNIQEFLQDAIDILLKEFLGRDKRLVIIIDDLDRCSSQTAYRLLEGIKVYLELNNCVFVLGLNQKIVIDSIAKEMHSSGSNNDIKIIAEAYLEKLCCNFERLTPPKSGVSLLLEWITEGDFKDILSDALTDNNNNFIECLPPNPRRIKALSNVLNQWFEKVELPDVQEGKIKTAISLVIISYVYQFHSELFHRWQYTPSLFTSIPVINEGA